jgi:hypothetical protein
VRTGITDNAIEANVTSNNVWEAQVGLAVSAGATATQNNIVGPPTFVSPPVGISFGCHLSNSVSGNTITQVETALLNPPYLYGAKLFFQRCQSQTCWLLRRAFLHSSRNPGKPGSSRKSSDSSVDRSRFWLSLMRGQRGLTETTSELPIRPECGGGGWPVRL